MITAEYFELRTGAPPIQDDLERCNCEKAGQIGHWQCGWNKQQDQPVFAVGREE